MESNRALAIKPKTILILDSRFPIFESLIIGENGQAVIEGVIEGEELVMQDDGTELLMKTIRLDKIEAVGNRAIKISIGDK